MKYGRSVVVRDRLDLSRLRLFFDFLSSIVDAKVLGGRNGFMVVMETKSCSRKYTAFRWVIEIGNCRTALGAISAKYDFGCLYGNMIDFGNV